MATGGGHEPIAIAIIDGIAIKRNGTTDYYKFNSKGTVPTPLMSGSQSGDESSASYAYSALRNNANADNELIIYCKRITDAFDSTNSKHISFTGVNFTRVPYVTIGVYGTNSYTVNNVNVFNVTKTGCDFRVTSNNGASGSAFFIIAIQPC